jgi:hypothetical protein
MSTALPIMFLSKRSWRHGASSEIPLVKIGFLFNHDAAHQVTHSVGIMLAYAAEHPTDEVIALVSPPLKAPVQGWIGGASVTWCDFLPGPYARTLAPLLDRVAPFSRRAALSANLELIAGLDALVATERTCLWAKRKLGARAPAFIYIPHGAGDRGVTYHPDLAQFDLLLVPGSKWVEAAKREHLVHAGNEVAIIGYPKFDLLAENTAVQSYFANKKPVFVYNPHFDPYLSSWYDCGPALIDWFADHADYNLIVAPHVMLFRKKFHWSLEYRTGRTRPDIPPSARAPNILVDVDSARLFDMSYMRSADAYIGDASSQIYEFMSDPRPAFFIDSRRTAWAGDPRYLHWRAGPVGTSMDALTAMLPDYLAIGEKFAPAQHALFAETFDPSPIPAARRGAQAIAAYMAKHQC